MRKFLRSFVMMALLAVPFVTQAQNTLIVADGTTTNSYVPFYGYMGDAAQHNQMIYPATDLTAMVGMEITEMTLFVSSGTTTMNGWEISLGTTTATTLSGIDNSVSVSQVYSGSLSTSSGQMNIVFSEPWVYDGGNLLVDFNHQASNWASYSFYGVEATGASYSYNSQRNFLPKVQFTYQIPPTCRKVKNLAVTDITSNSATLTWTDAHNTGATYTVYNGTTQVATGLTTTSYSATGLTPSTPYTFSVVANCSATDASEATVVSFSTTQVPTTVPFVTGFEAGDDQGFTFVNSDVNAWVYGEAVNNGGSRAMYISNDGSSNAYSVSGIQVSYAYRLIQVTEAGMYNVSFDWKSQGESNYDYLRAWLAPSDAVFTAGQLPSGSTSMSGYTTTTPAGWIDLGGKMNLVSSWQTAQHFFADLATGTYQLVFMWGNDNSGGTQPPVAIDNIAFEHITCAPLVSAAVEEATANSITLSWYDQYNTGVTYTIMNGENVVATGITDTFYTVTGLERNTSYDFSIIANCSATDASPAFQYSARTACGLTPLPYTTSFEDDPYYASGITTYAQAVPYCWNRINDATGTYNYYPYNANSTSSAHTGAHYLYFYAYTSTSYATNQMAIMPQIDVTVNPMNNNMVQFWAKRSTNASSVEVGTMSDPTDMSTFTVAQEVELTTTYTQYRVKFTNAPATDAYVAFRMVKGSSTKYVYLDDVTLDTIPAVWPVVAAQVDSVTDASISISWEANPENGDVTYTVYDGATAVATGITETHTTITGLTANTSYTFAVVAVAGNKESTPVEVEGRTDCDYNLVLSLPISMGFEDAELNDLYCWSAIYGSTDNASANQMVRAILGEDTVWRFSSFSSASDYNQYLVSPRFSTTEPVKVTFSHVNHGYESDQIQVVYFAPNAAGDGDTVIEATDWMSASTMTTDSAYLPAEATRVGFHYYGNYSYYYYIDNINLSVAPTHNVTFNYINQEGNSEVWGSAAVDGLAYEGMNATLVSTPGEYKRTAAWYAGNITDTTGLTALAIDTNAISFGPVMGDTAVTVFYGYGQFRIAAAPNQERMGEVVADPASANNMYDYQSEVTLTANAADGFMFKEWLNAEDHSFFSNDNPLTLTATQNYNLTARFVIDTFAITIVTENGTVEGADQGYMFGEVATITAVPDEHYEFYYWADTVDGVSISAESTLTFRVLSDTTFYPVFGPLQYTVTIDGDPTRATYVIMHGDEENLAGTGDYTYGDTLTVVVRDINENYDWMGWKVGDETVTTDTAYTFVLEDNITFFANIPGGMYTMTFATNDMDMGSVKIDSVRLEDGTVVDYADSTTLTVTLNYGSIIYATASPVSQYAQFNGWSHGTPDLMSLSAAFNVVNDTTVYANFGFQVYNVTLNIEPALTGSAVADPAAPEYGETVAITATAEPHWVFANWTDTTGAVVSTDNPYTTGLLFEDIELTANFVRDSHNVVALVADETHGTTEVTNAAAEVATRFMHTDMATVAFTEGYGYTFAGWSDGTAIVSTDNPYTFEVEDDVELTATVSPIPYNVTVYSGEAQRGTASVAESPVNYLDYATLNFTVNYGYVFDYWANEAGDTLSEDENYSPQVLSDTTIVAHFTFYQFTVTGAAHEECVMMGTVAPATGEYDYLSTATLTATANYGYHFTKWIDAAGNELGTAETIDITVESDSNVFAMFDYDPMDVIVNVNDPLFGTAATTVAAPYFFSQTITVEASAAEHYHFVNWTNANGDEVSADNPYTFILTEPIELTANFAIDTHTVTLVYNENAVTEIHGDGSYIYGTDVEIGLTEAYGFTFTGWDNGETLNPFTLHVESDTTIEALFTTNQYTVTAEVAAASTGMGTVSGTNTVDYMSYVILVATPEYGYDFVNWTNANGEVASTELTFAVQATQDTTFYANFTEHSYTLTIASADDVMGTVSFPDAGADPVLTVADGTNTNSYVPVYGSYLDDPIASQSIYPASMLTSMVGANITGLHYYVSSGSMYSYSNVNAWEGKVFKVSLAVTTNETVPSGFDQTPRTEVYSGSLTASVEDGLNITFDQPFTYNGGNLLIAIQANEDDLGVYASMYFYGTNVTAASRSGYGINSYNFAATGTARNFLPKVTFDYQVAGDGPVSYEGNVAYVKYNNSVNVAAEANYGYHFTGWSNEVATENTSVLVVSDSTLTANFAKNQYTITAAVGGDMAGTVAGTATVDYLDTVTLTATPSADHRLLRWVNANDEILGTDTTLTIIAERDSTITAVFGYQVYTLTANTEDFEMGGVYVEDPASMGAPMEIFADDFESGIANWTNEGDGTWTAGAGDYSSTTGSHSGSANAKITHSSTGNATKLISPVIDLSAYTSPELNFWFVNRSWAGDIDELNVYYRTSETSAWQSLQTYTDAHSTYTEATFTLPEPSATYQIAFEMVDNYGYGVAVDDVVISGILAGVAPSLATSYADVDYTTNVNIYATPAEHYHFVGWMNEAGDTVLTNANETITVLGDSTLTALFDGDVMPMTYQVNNAIRGAVEGPATGEFNTEVEFEAIAAHGYEFAKWEDGNTDNPRTVTVLGTDAENTYKAIFDYEKFDMHVTVENGTLENELENPYYYGTQLTLTAVANEHYNQWKGWFDVDGNLVSIDNPYTMFVLGDIDLNGVFEIDSVNYTFASNDMTMGTVTSSIEAGRYAYETEVTLTATVAGEDYHFVDWNDGETAAERTVVLTQDTNLVANFALNQYNIATVAENGTAVWAGYDYAYPTVNITINAEDSYGDGWDNGQFSIAIKKGGLIVDTYTMASQGVYSTHIYDTYVNNIVNDGDITFEWVDNEASTYSYPEEISFSINVDGAEVYSINNASSLANADVLYTIPAATPAMTEVVPEGTTPVNPHTNLTFTATPDAGYNFVNWTDNDGNIVSSANPVIVEIVSDTTLVANFSTEVYTVVAVSTDTVKGTVSPATANLTVEQGALLTATPKYGYVFVNWTDKLGAELSTDAAFTLTDVTIDSVFANFNYDYFDVTVAANDNAWGSVTLNNSTVLTGNFPYGDTVTLRATAADGYYFVNWTNNAGAVVSDQLMCTFIVEADETYTANFADGSTYTITAVADTNVHGNVTGAGDYMAGQVATLTAVAFPNYFFTEWNDSNTDNPRAVTVTADADFVAIFDTVAYSVTVNGETEAVKYGRSYTVIAADSACRTFNGWSNGTEVVASGNQYTFVVTGDITLTATYSDAITYTAEETVAYCGTYNWNGEDRTASGDYTYTTTTAAGCDSTITLHLTISDVMTSTDVQTSCGSFTWIDGITYTESNNTATFTTTASNGCDSVITLNLTVNNPAGTSTTATECGSYTWNGTDYTTSGTYNYSYTDNNGCTVVDTLVLTINQPTTETVNASACGSYTWNGETYTASGIYTDTLTNVAGCDSIVTLALTINQPVYSTISETACDSYTWTDGDGMTYTASGSYVYSVAAANGCDSIVTLNLTINNAVTATETVTACSSYLWNGTEYTISGSYTWTGNASNGCDSVVTLDLTITPAAIGSSDTVEICDSYEWNGTTYTASGDYTYTATAANGCDSISTLHLTINQSVYVTETQTVEENIVWNGTTYTESGTYTYTTTAANGCDSVVTLVLTVTGAQVPDTNYYTVSIETANPGMGTLTGAGTYAEGTVVTLTATPNEGYGFVAWMVGNDTVCTTPEYTFTLVSDTTVSAVFVALPVYYTVTGVANDTTMGTVYGSRTCEAGETVTLTAQAKNGYHFVRWSNGHAEPTISFTVTGDITLTAYFEANEPVTGIEESDMENVTIYSAESTIYVRGAEGKDVNVYDINGRTISSKVNAGESIEFRMSATGVYLVKVGNAPAKRVLVVR